MISSAIRSSGISRSNRRVCLETTAQSRYKLTGPSHNSFVFVRARKTLPSALSPISQGHFLRRVIHSPGCFFQRQAASHEKQDSPKPVHVPRRVKNPPRLRDPLNDPLLFEVAEFRGRDLQPVE